jgi:hypothetical protein
MLSSLRWLSRSLSPLQLLVLVVSLCEGNRFGERHEPMHMVLRLPLYRFQNPDYLSTLRARRASRKVIRVTKLWVVVQTLACWFRLGANTNKSRDNDSRRARAHTTGQKCGGMYKWRKCGGMYKWRGGAQAMPSPRPLAVVCGHRGAYKHTFHPNMFPSVGITGGYGCDGRSRLQVALAQCTLDGGVVESARSQNHLVGPIAQCSACADSTPSVYILSIQSDRERVCVPHRAARTTHTRARLCAQPPHYVYAANLACFHPIPPPPPPHYPLVLSPCWTFVPVH